MTKPSGYRTILIDAPTSIEQTSPGKGAIEHYELLTMERLQQLPVAELAAPDSHLYLWTTNAALEQSMALIRHWGFTPRSILTWIKPRMGLGHYLRNTTEQLLLATRGHAPVRFKGQPTWAFAPIQDHSHKPEEQFAIIERLSPGPYLELFARRKPTSSEQWDYWGNEVPSTISLLEFGWPAPSDFDEQDVEEPRP